MPDTVGKAELTVVTCTGKIHMSLQLYSPRIVSIQIPSNVRAERGAGWRMVPIRLLRPAVV